MMADGRAGFLDGIQNGGVVALKFSGIVHPGDEDEVQVGALRVAVAHVRGDDGIGQRMADRAHIAVHLRHIGPVDAALQRIGDDAEIHEGIAEIRVIEAALFPALGHIAGHGHGTKAAGNAVDILRHIFGKALFAIGKAQEHTALHILVAQLIQQRGQRCFIHIVELEHQVGLFGVGKAKHRGIAAFALHHLPGGRHGGLPIPEHIGEALSVFRLPAEYLEGHLGQHAEGPLRAHHDLVEIGAGGLPGIMGSDDAADGGGVLLRKDDIGDGAIVGAVLARAAGDHPAAHAAVLEGLGEMAAGILPLGAKAIGGILQGFLQRGAGKPRLHRDGLVHLIEAEDLIEALSHIQRDAALDGLHAAGNGAAAAVDIQRELMLRRITDKLFHLLGGIGVDHHIRQAVDLLVPQTQKIVAGAAIGHRKSFVIPRGNKFFPDDLFQRLQVLRGDARGVIRERDLIKADIIGVVPEVLIGHMEGFLHHLVEGFLGVLEKLGIAPAEDGTIAARRGGSQQPLGLEAFVRFIAHGHSPFRFSLPAGRR